MSAPARNDLLAACCRRLGVMLRTGVSLSDALERLRDVYPSLAGLLNDLAVDTRHGATLTRAMERKSASVPTLLHSVITAGEAGEDLPAALDDAADLLDRAQEQQRALWLALTYPRLVFWVVILLGWLLLAFCGPVLIGPFEGMNLVLPLQTKILVQLSKLMTSPASWVIVPALLVVASAIFSIEPWADGARQNLPLLGELLRRADDVTWLYWTDFFISRGRPLAEAVRLGSSACLSPTYRRRMGKTADEMERGSRLSDALSHNRHAASLVVWLVRQAEAAEFRPGLLRHAGDALSREIELTANCGLGLVEPVLLAGLALLVGFFLSVFAPLYKFIGSMS